MNDGKISAFPGRERLPGKGTAVTGRQEFDHISGGFGGA